MREQRSKDPFKVGDVAVWTTRHDYSSSRYFGKVTRVTPAGTVFARSGTSGKEAEFRKSQQHSHWGIQHVTKLELARAAWAQARPNTNYVEVHRGYGNGMDRPPNSVHVISIDNPENALAAANELIAVAQWWGAYPKDPE